VVLRDLEQVEVGVRFHDGRLSVTGDRASTPARAWGFRGISWWVWSGSR
jgi:hypothetical protein